jgi:large subunit ribosomal protein L29
MSKAKDLRDKSLEDLEANYNDACKALFDDVNSRKTTKKNDKPHLPRQMRKDIARLLTVMTEKRSQQRTV